MFYNTIFPKKFTLNPNAEPFVPKNCSPPLLVHNNCLDDKEEVFNINLLNHIFRISLYLRCQVLHHTILKNCLPIQHILMKIY